MSGKGFSRTLTTSPWLNKSAACLHYVAVKGCLKIEAKAPGYEIMPGRVLESNIDDIVLQFAALCDRRLPLQ